MRDQIQSAQHWVVKIGSGVLLRDSVHVDRPTFVTIVRSVVSLVEAGHRVTLVSSGAVALGRQIAGDYVSADLPSLQAFAALGQARLIRMYDEEFQQYDRRAAQVLFGRRDLDQRQGFLNARMTLDAVHRTGAIAVINENDTVATEGLRFDDNDELAGMTCGLVKADLLVVLSDVDGVYDVETDAEGGRFFTDRIPEIGAEDERLRAVAGPSASGHGTGGMISKVRAAQMAGRMGIGTVIAPGKHPNVLEEIREGLDVGTYVFPQNTGVVGRKIWLGSGALPTGCLVVDEGAERALKERGASLLPSGITRVDGDFPEGAVVELVGVDGDVFARGMVSYPSRDIATIAGHRSDAIAELLGYSTLDSVVHRDSMIVLRTDD